MSEEKKQPHSVLGNLFRIAEQLEPLDQIKNPYVAAACGFLGGGIALGLYLQSWKDALIPFCILATVLIVGFPIGETLVLFTPPIWAAYGFYRVKTSNANLTGYSSRGKIIDAEVIQTPPPIPTSRKY
jgi:hypothetical protein